MVVPHRGSVGAPALLLLLTLFAATAPRAAGCSSAKPALDITDFGAKAGASGDHAAQANAAAINRTLAAAVSQGPGCTVLVPAGRFVTFGGIVSEGLRDTTVRIDGVLELQFSTTLWPGCGGKKCEPFMQFNGAANLTITSSVHFPPSFPTIPDRGWVAAAQAANGSGDGLASPIHPIRTAGLIDGKGAKWWDWKLLTGKKCPSPLINVASSSDVLLEQLQLVNSPSFHVRMSDVKTAEIRYIDIYVDRKVQRAIRARHAGPTIAAAGEYPPQDPAWLNTDGIDPAGDGFWIHHCSIVNDDDSVAVKPSSGPPSALGVSCSQNMLIEHMVMTGVGASIGSVPPHPTHNCVRNITFRNVTMPGTTKGIYVKSNPSCRPGATAEITNVVYEDFRIVHPSWWAVWIGPQQQHEPKSALGLKCALDWPITNQCPTQGCVGFPPRDLGPEEQSPRGITSWGPRNMTIVNPKQIGKYMPGI
jgi:hypothetical protein